MLITSINIITESLAIQHIEQYGDLQALSQWLH